MKATPIAEYLQRKGAEAERPAPAAPALRRAPIANDDAEPEFRKSGLVAALARRSPEGPPLVRPITPSFAPPRREAPPPPPPAMREAELEERLSEAYHRGVQEGLDAGKNEAATARALERAELQKRAVIEKLDFQMNEYARLSETLATGFAEVERRVAQAAARLLKPLLRETLALRVVEEMSENIARMMRAGAPALIKVRGPERLLAALKAKIDTLAVDVDYAADDAVEITVTADTTEIQSQLASWATLINDIVEDS